MKSRTVDTDDLVSLFREAVVDNCLIHRFSFAEPTGRSAVLVIRLGDIRSILITSSYKIISYDIIMISVFNKIEIYVLRIHTYTALLKISNNLNNINKNNMYV